MNIRGERPISRTEELIIAFSLDELDAAGQRELYDLLTGPEGQAHTKEAWAILRQSGDLRCTLPNDFAQTVNSRLAAEQSGASVLGPVLRGIGQVRAKLPDIPTHPPKSKPSWGLLWFALTLVLLAALVWGLWYSFRQRGSQVEILGVQGQVEAAGLPLILGHAPLGRMISLAAKSQTELRFVDGSQVTIYGSASLQVQHDGFSLRGGQAAINTVQALSVGLPDCSLQIQAGSRLRLDATRLGAVTVLQGSVTIHRGNLHTIIPAGSSGDGWRIYPALDQALHAAQTLQTPNHPCRWSLSILCGNTPLRVQHSQGDLELRENSLYGLSDGPQPLIPATRRQFLFDADALGTTLRCEPGGQILQLRWTTPPIAVQGSEVSGRFIVGVPILAVEKVSHSSISPH